jgi:hypothetical protein
MACYGWVWYRNLHGQDLDTFPSVARWFALLGKREGVRRGRELGIDVAPPEFRNRLRAAEWKVKVSPFQYRSNRFCVCVNQGGAKRHF